MSKHILECKDLTFSYERNQKVLDGISFYVQEGESVGLIGANGVGKSTLMKLLVGLCDGYEGSLTVQDLPVDQKHIDEIREKIGYVFQDSDNQLFMVNVYEDVAFGPRNYGYDETEVQRRVMEALEMVQISHLKDKQIYKLSGGEKKLASIATILSMKPELMLMDEPSVALDPKHRRQLIQILNGIPTAKLIASHDLEFIRDTCERTILMKDGKVLFDGKTSEILENKEMLERAFF